MWAANCQVSLRSVLFIIESTLDSQGEVHRRMVQAEDKGFLGTLIDDNPTGDGHGEYCLQKCPRPPHTIHSREAAAPQEERLGEGIAIGGHRGHGQAGGSTHSSAYSLFSLLHTGMKLQEFSHHC